MGQALLATASVEHFSVHVFGLVAFDSLQPSTGGGGGGEGGGGDKSSQVKSS